MLVCDVKETPLTHCSIMHPKNWQSLKNLWSLLLTNIWISWISMSTTWDRTSKTESTCAYWWDCWEDSLCLCMTSTWRQRTTNKWWVVWSGSPWNHCLNLTCFQVHNVAFSFDLMQDVGLAKPKARPEDIVNLDLKSTLRVLYNLFTKYRNIA